MDGANRLNSSQGQIAVIIAAHNAERTIGRALRSALREQEVAEVVVVDDASGDATVSAAQSADDGTGRLAVIACAANGGPGAARNRAIDASTAPFIAILDADDFFIAGRFRAMGFGGRALPASFDAVADNIVFAGEEALHVAKRISRRAPAGPAVTLDLETLINGNVSRPGQPRGELGFLKPVLRRAFLDRHQLRYNPALRLGEDFELYTRLLAQGGRFHVLGSCGYLAVERSNSLSAAHSASDLAALADADGALLASLPLQPAERAALLRHQAHVLGKCDHRQFLDKRRAEGLRAALGAYTAEPARLGAILRAVATDKLKQLSPVAPTPRGPRLLLPAGRL